MLLTAALIPPGFGGNTSYLPGSGEPLTPNLTGGAVTPGYPCGGGMVSYPSTSSPIITAPITAYTAVTADPHYSDGHLATLKIPALGFTVKVYLSDADDESDDVAAGLVQHVLRPK